MTTDQVKYVVEDLLEDKMDAITPLSKCLYLVLTKQECKFVRLKNYLFNFDSTNEVLRVYPYRIVKETPTDNSNYFEANGVIYECMQDDDGNVLCDVYPFDQIISFKLV